MAEYGQAERLAVAEALREHERALAAQANPTAEAKVAAQPLDPRSMRPREESDPGPALTRPARPPLVPGSYDPALGRVPMPGESFIDSVKAGQEARRTYEEADAEVPATEKLKETGRAALAMASGGLTERTAESVAGAGDKAAGEVTAQSLETMNPNDLAQLMARLNPEERAAVYSVVKPHWQPGTRTEAQGTTGKDPNAVRAGFAMQDKAEQTDMEGLRQTQEADRGQYESLQKVQQNEMQAVQTFQRQNDELQDRYAKERAAQFDRMSAIQKAMDSVPDAPNNIPQWFEKSGTKEKMALGLAAAFSVLGGATLRDGGKSVQTMLGNIQANIDRGVAGEKAQHDALGKRLGASQSIYANLRQALGDDIQAQNITKAMYYDAAQNVVQQIATQYKLDTQSPQIQSLLSHLARERQKLILDTAGTMQNQFSQTDKFNPGGVVQVGGGAAKSGYKSTDLRKDTAKFSEELEKRGFNMGERAIGLYQKSLDAMKQAGFKNDEKFKKAFVAIFDTKGDIKTQATALALLDPKERSALQYIVEANKEQLKDASGKSVTAGEMVRDVLSKGGYSIDSLDQVRRTLAAGREQIYNSTAAGFAPEVIDLYDANKEWLGLTRRHAGIGTDSRQPIDVKDIERKVEGRLRK